MPPRPGRTAPRVRNQPFWREGLLVCLLALVKWMIAAVLGMF
jgi:hypothetical protein